MRGLKPNGQRAKIAIVFIWIVLVARFIFLISSFFRLKRIQDSVVGDFFIGSADVLNDPRHFIIGLAVSLLFLISSIFYVMWINRAYSNLQLKSKYLSINKIWATWSWYIPVINLILPFYIMRDLYFESYKLLRNESLVPKKEVNFNYVSFWWGLWVFGTVSGFALFQFSRSTSAFGWVYIVINWEILNSIIFIITSFLALKVIKDYVKMEILMKNLVAEKSNKEFIMGNDDLLDSGF